MCTYESKKASSLKRGIAFDLSREEFDALMKIRDDRETRCVYSHKTFIFKENHIHYPSLERLNDRDSYNLRNCVWTTIESNRIKDVYIDKIIKKPPQDPRLPEYSIYNAIKKKMAVDNWKEVLWQEQIGCKLPEHLLIESKPQLEALESNTEELQEQTGTLTLEKEEMQQNQPKEVLDKSQHLQETTEEAYKLENSVLKDLFIATCYTHLLNFAIKNKIDFKITLSQFRGLMLKKTCSLSSDVLLCSEDVATQPKLLLKDTTAGYVLGNVIVVSGKTQNLIGEAREVFGKDLSDVTKILANLKSL